MILWLFRTHPARHFGGAILGTLSRNKFLAYLALLPMFWVSIEGAAYKRVEAQKAHILKIAENLGVIPELFIANASG